MVGKQRHRSVHVGENIAAVVITLILAGLIIWFLDLIVPWDLSHGFLMMGSTSQAYACDKNCKRKHGWTCGTYGCIK